MKVKFNRRYSLYITIVACAVSVWLMVGSFGFPVSEVIKFAWICLLLLAALIVVAALLAYISRKFFDMNKS